MNAMESIMLTHSIIVRHGLGLAYAVPDSDSEGYLHPYSDKRRWAVCFLLEDVGGHDEGACLNGRAGDDIITQATRKAFWGIG